MRVLEIQCINFELKIAYQLFNFVAVYRSPSQIQGAFEKYSDNFELNLGPLPPKNFFLVVAIGHFNSKSKSWYFNDGTTSQGNVLRNITSQFGLQQIIKEAIHILENNFLVY